MFYKMHDNIMIIADGTQQILLRRPGSDLETEIPCTLKRMFRSRRHYRVDETLVSAKSAHWYFSRHASTMSPLEGDEIVEENGEVWTIIEVNRSELNETWQCVARSYTTRFGMDEHVDHLKIKYIKTAAGTLENVVLLSRSGIAAKISEATLTFDDVRREILYVLIRENLDIQIGDMLRRPDGKSYEIEKVHKPLYRNAWTEIQLKHTDW